MSDRTLDLWIKEWADEEVRASDKAGWSGTNPIWRVRFSPGLATQISEHKVLYWPRTRGVAKIAAVAKRLTYTDRLALIASARSALNDDGTPLKDEDFCRFFGISIRKLSAYVNRAKSKLRKLLQIK